MTKIDCIIMDWAGTAIDFGCFAPLNVFLRIFEEKGINLTYHQARQPMGLLKIDHIRALLLMPEVSGQFRAVHGRDWDQSDVESLYESFEGHLFESLADFTDPVPGVVETIGTFRSQGIRIGSTTGYTDAMMDIVRPAAAEKGYAVDNLITPSSMPAGRPAPYMIYQNMIDLAVPSVDRVVKVGDTIADIMEGVNARVHTVGVVTGSNELGLSLEEYNAMPKPELEEMKSEVIRRMMDAGAHYVIDSILDLPECIEQINESLNTTK